MKLDETQNFINCGHKKTGTNPEVQSQGSMYREMAGVPKSIYVYHMPIWHQYSFKVKIDASYSISGKIENSCLLESHESFTCRNPKINHNIQRKSLVLLEWFRQTRRINSLDFWSAVMDDRSESRILNLALWLLDHLKMIGEFGDKKIWDANCDIWQIF